MLRSRAPLVSDLVARPPLCGDLSSPRESAAPRAHIHRTHIAPVANAIPAATAALCPWPYLYPYRCPLLDFRIWSQTGFAVRLGPDRVSATCRAILVNSHWREIQRVRSRAGAGESLRTHPRLTRALQSPPWIQTGAFSTFLKHFSTICTSRTGTPACPGVLG